jgi:hypothetical protein
MKKKMLSFTVAYGMRMAGRRVFHLGIRRVEIRLRTAYVLCAEGRRGFRLKTRASGKLCARGIRCNQKMVLLTPASHQQRAAAVRDVARDSDRLTLVLSTYVMRLYHKHERGTRTIDNLGGNCGC